MIRGEMVKEIERVETALEKANSWKLKREYNKHLKRLKRELAYYDKFMAKK